MISTIRQILNVVLSVGGLIFAIIACALPIWKVVYVSIEDIQYVEEGLWEACAVLDTGLKNCGTYIDPSKIDFDLKAGRAMTIICIMLSTLGLLASLVGSDFTTFINNEDIKSKVRLGAGIVLLLAGLFLLISVSWSANSLSDKGNPGILMIRGPCLYIGWVGGVFLVVAACLLWPKWRNNSYSTL